MLIPSRLRAARRRREMTIQALADCADIHKAHLSRIERGEKTPSLGTLMALAKALGTDMAELFGETAAESDVTIVRSEERTALPGDALYGVEAVLAASRERPLALYVVKPGEAFLEHDLPEHDGFESLFVLSGTIEVQVTTRTFTLNSGDCAAYDAHLTHRIRRVGEEQASVLVAITRDH